MSVRKSERSLERKLTAVLSGALGGAVQARPRLCKGTKSFSTESKFSENHGFELSTGAPMVLGEKLGDQPVEKLKPSF